jgi:4-hydroxy-tetrahydrodipicolinate synthase
MPACVTPFDQQGAIDFVSLARLIAYFHGCGCSGVVVAGTNGEGPSLSAVEKRDLVKAAVPLSGGMKVILGISTPSLPEAKWLAEQAGKSGADGVLVMAPGYFRNASGSGVVKWFEEVASASPIPMLAYNYPKYTGFTFTKEVVEALSLHPNIKGIIDSSGDRANLDLFRKAAPDIDLCVGDETLLLEALGAGWQGTISGAANLVPQWLVRIVDRFGEEGDFSQSCFEIVKPVLEAIRQGTQPATNKAVLADWGLISHQEVRLPLENVDASELIALIELKLGLRSANLGIPKRNYLV